MRRPVKGASEPIKVNEILGKQPSLGLLSANQILPLMLIVVGCYAVLEGFLGFGFPVVAGASLWLGTTWLLLTGNDPDSYLNLFRQPTCRDWTIGGAIYVSPLSTNRTVLDGALHFMLRTLVY